LLTSSPAAPCTKVGTALCRSPPHKRSRPPSRLVLVDLLRRRRSAAHRLGVGPALPSCCRYVSSTYQWLSQGLSQGLSYAGALAMALAGAPPGALARAFPMVLAGVPPVGLAGALAGAIEGLSQGLSKGFSEALSQGLSPGVLQGLLALAAQRKQPTQSRYAGIRKPPWRTSRTLLVSQASQHARATTRYPEICLSISLSRGFLPSESKWRLGCALSRFTLLPATLCKVRLVTVYLTSSAVPFRPTTLIHEFQFFPKFFPTIRARAKTTFLLLFGFLF